MTSPYQQQTERNAQKTAAQVGTILAAWQAGTISADTLPTWLSGAIRLGAGRAVHMADAGLSAQLGQIIGRPVPMVGLVLPSTTIAAIGQGVDTVLPPPDELEHLDDSAQADLVDQAQRLASSAPLEAGQVAHQDAMEAQGIEGWIRQTDPDPCELCQALADGTVIPINKKMITHPNCSCVAVPVLTGAEPFQHPDDGPDDAADFVPTTLRTGSGIFGREFTRVRPGLTVSRSMFIPSTKGARR